MDGIIEEQELQQAAPGETTQAPQEGAQAVARGGENQPEAIANEGRQAFEAIIAERDERIAELEGQILEAAKSAEAAEQLRDEIAALREQFANERIDYTLKLAGCRNAKAARAVLEDYDGDVDALKAGEPWLFSRHLAPETASGATGLPSAGAASDEGSLMQHWRELAGLDGA